MKVHDQPIPTIFIIFGGTGDLVARKLIPALFDLFLNRSMPDLFSIIAVGRAEIKTEELVQQFYDGVVQFSHLGKENGEAWQQFARHIIYHQGAFADQHTYAGLSGRCDKLDEEWKVKAQRIFYLATPPSLFGGIAENLGAAGMADDRERARIVIEKPFGYDLDSACALNALLTRHFHESQIFRIDHYLGKETVQNILAFRFANPIFEPIWNRRYVEYVTITVAEEVGVEYRGKYYEHSGALRDMVQNHLMQLLCMVAMEPMVSFDADEIRNKKVDILHALRPIPHDTVHQRVVRGQYGSGWIRGKEVRAYRDEEGVAHDSQTETFVALKLFIDNWRWKDVPFYLRTGKSLTRQDSEIVIQFRAVPHQAFPSKATLDWQSSRLVMSIQPNEGIVLSFQAKYPGPKLQLKTVEMRFSYQETFAARSQNAYETLLWDVMRNDATLFMRADQIEAAWRFLMPVLEVWAASPPSDFPNYAAGTWGPEDSQSLLARHGHSWPLAKELVKRQNVAPKRP